MDGSGLTQLFQANTRLILRQQREWVEIAVDWETANKYAVFNEAGERLAYVAERAGGIGKALLRSLLRAHRPLIADVFGGSGDKLLHLERPFFFLFSKLAVTSPGTGLLGRVVRRFGILHKVYDLIDETGQVFARIKSPVWRLWTFPVRGGSVQQQAVISKKWSGALQEIFSDADSFMVDFVADGTGEWTHSQKAVIFAAAVSIDFDFFEDNTD